MTFSALQFSFMAHNSDLTHSLTGNAGKQAGLGKIWVETEVAGKLPSAQGAVVRGAEGCLQLDRLYYNYKPRC